MGDAGRGRLTAIGGGTLGRADATNDWLYGLCLGGRLHRRGTDLHSGATGKTHHQIAVLLGECLAADASLEKQTRGRLAAWVEQQRADREGPDDRPHRPGRRR